MLQPTEPYQRDDRHSLSRPSLQCVRDTMSGRNVPGVRLEIIYGGAGLEGLPKWDKINMMQCDFHLRQWICERAYNENSPVVVYRLDRDNISGSDWHPDTFQRKNQWPFLTGWI